MLSLRIIVTVVTVMRVSFSETIPCLFPQQPQFLLLTESISANLSICPHHPMAWHKRSKGILMQCIAHSARALATNL